MYTYNGVSFRSSLELAYYIYCRDNGFDICETDLYIRITNGTVSEKDADRIYRFVYHKHGRNFLKKFKDKTAKDFKRKVVEYDGTLESISKYRNRTVKVHYRCSSCSKDVFTTWRIVNHFDDGLCKRCRKKLQENTI